METKEIPQATADRYLAMLTDFVSAARNAVAAAGGSPQSAIWTRKVLPLLEGQLSAAQTTLAHHAIGDQQPLVERAKYSLSLARDLDGYPLDFAGEAFAAQLSEHIRLIVFAAWQVCQTAGAV